MSCLITSQFCSTYLVIVITTVLYNEVLFAAWFLYRGEVGFLSSLQHHLFTTQMASFIYLLLVHNYNNLFAISLLHTDTFNTCIIFLLVDWKKLDEKYALIACARVPRVDSVSLCSLFIKLIYNEHMSLLIGMPQFYVSA